MSIASNDLGFGVVGQSPLADVSILKMFLGASFLVKVIVVLLIAASFVSWSIIFSKLMLVSMYKKQAKLLESKVQKNDELDMYYSKNKMVSGNLFIKLFNNAYGKFLNCKKENLSEELSIKDVNNVMNIGYSYIMAELERLLSVLATVASVSPFVGLFGTVWGIMTSFQSIANAKNTSLAVVAPGIAEALLVTAIGLFAAIPALIFYNKFINDINGISIKIENSVETLEVFFRKKMKD